MLNHSLPSAHPLQWLRTTGFRSIRLIPIIIWTFVLVVPIASVLTVAVKSNLELLNNPLGWPQQFIWSNFATAWDESNLGQALLNSIIITSVAVVGIVLLGAMAAYPLARRGTRAMNGLYYYFIAGLIIPFQFGLIPLYQLWTTLGLVNTLPGIILIHIGATLPFAIFFYTGFMKGIPRELEEAAAIDGAGAQRTFWTIVFPLLRPVTATVIIVASLGIWNDFLGALIFLQDPSLQTFPLAIYGFVGQYGQQSNLIFASIIMVTLPIAMIFLLLQRSFIKGLAGGALAN